MDFIPHIEDPEQLERLYRADPVAFERALTQLNGAHADHVLVRAWRARLAPLTAAGQTAPPVRWGKVVGLAVAAAVVARLLHLGDRHESAEQLLRFGGFILVVPLCVLLRRRRELQRHDLALAGVTCAALVSAGLMPLPPSQSGLLGMAHLPLLLLVLLYGAVARDIGPQPAELVAVGVEIAIFTLAILFGGVLLTGLTVGVFSLIKLDIVELYVNNVVVAGVAAAPIIATGLERARVQRSDRLGSALARIFAPLALMTLLAYVLAIIGTQNNPYQSRESLAMLYAMLLATALLVTLMVVHTGERAPSRGVLLLACTIAGLSVAIDAVALSAIIYRFASFGLSPNRLAVLGGNVLLFGYLAGLTTILIRVLKRTSSEHQPMHWIATYIPLFGIWSALWVFAFPLLFKLA